MSEPRAKNPKTDWTGPNEASEDPVSDYQEWLANEIVQGRQELADGKAIPAGEVWKTLGLD